ncbi:MAG: hypothetical protein EHM16_15570 [Betaproteobacteria bacterium]|nr:MAG: hypothetical protein EHM16_15570 [Betaproteobacteria bacterium]
MASKEYSREWAMAKLRQIDVLVDVGHSIHQVRKEIGITDVTFYHWCKGYNSLKSDQVLANECTGTGEPAPSAH